MDTNLLLVQELRNSFRNGFSVPELIKYVEMNLGYKSAIETVSYFIKAFGLTTKDSMDIMSYSSFGGGQLSDQDLEDVLKPLIEANRYKWDRA